MRRVAALLISLIVIAFLVLPAAAGTYLTVVATSIHDAAGNKLANGTFCMAATDNMDNPIESLKVGSRDTSRNAMPTQVCANVINGAITGSVSGSGTYQIANPANAYPRNVEYRVVVTDIDARTSTTYKGVIVTANDGNGDFDWDHYLFLQPPLPATNWVYGPPRPQGPAGFGYIPGLSTHDNNGITVQRKVSAAGIATTTGPVENVMSPAYGAKGDGSTDDTAAIQAAINALPVCSTFLTYAHCGEVYLPNGNYLISSTLTIDSEVVKLVGAGQRATMITCSVASGDCIKFAPTSEVYRDENGGLYDLTVWLNGSNQVGVHTIDFLQGFHMVNASVNRTSRSYGVGSVGWLAENDGAFTETQTERSVLNHISFAYDDIGIECEDTAASGTHNSIEHSNWQDVRWNLLSNQIAIQLNQDTNLTDSVINGTINPASRATGATVFSLTGLSSTYQVFETIWIDGTGTGVVGASTVAGSALELSGILSNYASTACSGYCWLPPSNGALAVYGKLYAAAELDIGHLTSAGYVRLVPEGNITYLESSKDVQTSGSCQPVYVTGAAAKPVLVKLDCSGNVNATGSVTAGNGTNIVYRCTLAGTLPVGALTTVSTNCGASGAVDTGLRTR